MWNVWRICFPSSISLLHFWKELLPLPLFSCGSSCSFSLDVTVTLQSYSTLNHISFSKKRRLHNIQTWPQRSEVCINKGWEKRIRKAESPESDQYTETEQTQVTEGVWTNHLAKFFHVLFRSNLWFVCGEVRISVKGEWKCWRMEFGEPSAMITGTWGLLPSCVENWALGAPKRLSLEPS